MAAVVGDDGNSPAQPNVCNTRHTRARPGCKAAKLDRGGER